MTGMRSRRQRYYYASTLPQLEAYAISKLPNLPGAYAMDVAIAAQTAAVNQAFSAEAVIDTLALSGLYYWDGRNGAGVAIGSAVSSLPSWGSAKTLSQGTSGNRPTQQSNNVLFDGADDFIENDTPSLSSSWSLVLALRGTSSAPSNTSAFFSSHNVTGGGVFQVDYSNTGNVRLNAAGQIASNIGVYTLNPFVVSVASSPAVNVWYNGNQAITNLSLGTALTIQRWRFGIDRFNSLYMPMEMYGAFGYEGVLSATQRIQLERYLNARYSLGVFS
jgi:hypothetical protein